MVDLEAIEVLTQAKERLFEHGWGKFNAPHRPDGSFCLEEAIVGVRGQFVCQGNVVHRRSAEYINIALGREAVTSLFVWNDRQVSANPVFDVIDSAIEIAKESPIPHV